MGSLLARYIPLPKGAPAEHRVRANCILKAIYAIPPEYRWVPQFIYPKGVRMQLQLDKV